MFNFKFRYLIILLLFGIFVPQIQAKEINLFDGLIKIHTSDNDGRPRHRDTDRNGHYEIIDGKLVWVEEIYDPEDHVIDSEPEMWVLLTRIENDDFDWVIIPVKDKHKIRKYLNRGYQRSMTGRKRSCYEMGRKKERLWERHHDFWQ